MSASSKITFLVFNRLILIKKSVLWSLMAFLVILFALNIFLQEPKNETLNTTENLGQSIHEIQISQNEDFASIKDTAFWETMARDANH